MESSYHSMYSSLHDPFGLHEMTGAGGYNYSNMSYGYMSPYYRYMRQPPVRQEMTCEWIDQDTKKMCNKVYYTLHDIVAHLTQDHIGGPEITDHACYWQNCPGRRKPSRRSTNWSTMSGSTLERNPSPAPSPAVENSLRDPRT